MLNSYILTFNNKIFVKSILFILLTFILIHLVYFEKFSREALKDDHEANRFNYIKQHGNNINIAAIGTSHTGNALQFSDSYFYNYGGMDGWYPQVMYSKFSHLLKNAPNLKVLFLEIDHISILTYDYKIHNKMPERYLYLLNNVKESLDESQMLKKVDTKPLLVSMKEDVAPVIHRKLIQKYLVGRNKKKIESQWSSKSKVEKDLSAEKRIKSYKLNKGLEIDTSVVKYFERVIKKANDHEIKVYLVYNPQTKEYLSKIKKENNLLVENFVNILSKKKDVTILDYRNYFDKNNDLYFSDQDHVNSEGSKLISKEIYNTVPSQFWNIMNGESSGL